MTAAETASSGAWPTAARLIARWLDQRERVDGLLDTLPRTLSGAERARCQHLVLGVVRHFGRIDAALGRLVAHPPRFATRAVLFILGFELLENSTSRDAASDRAPKIVHHAVEQTKALASPAEARLVNAVGRKLASALTRPAPAADASADELAEYFSHPAWLVRSWQAQFGPEATRALLEWNQKPAPVYARWRGNMAAATLPAANVKPIGAESDAVASRAQAGSESQPHPAESESGEGVPPEGGARSPSGPDADAQTALPAFLKPASWPGFHEVESGHWTEVESLLKTGRLYLQDPSTRLAVELAAPQANETILDLCAAPGGKALLLADTMKTGRLVAVDLPGGRIDRLKENLSRAGAVDVALVQADVLKGLAESLRAHRLPATYDAVLLDVPCSNTGVMRHRVDVKWRLQAGDFKKHPQQQLAMLDVAARLVAPGGRLVYSTCSIDTEENEHVVREFLGRKSGANFTLENSALSFPWTHGHDGGAAFRLRRNA